MSVNIVDSINFSNVNSMSEKIDVVSTYFVDVILMGEKCIFFRRTLLGVISMEEN